MKVTFSRRILGIFATLVVSSAVFTVPVSVFAQTTSQVFYVDGSGTQCSDGGAGTLTVPFCSIQAAIDRCIDPTVHYTIKVRGGTYYEPLSIYEKHHLTLQPFDENGEVEKVVVSAAIEALTQRGMDHWTQEGTFTGDYSGEPYTVYSFPHQFNVKNTPDPHIVTRNTVSVADTAGIDRLLWTYPGPTLFKMRHVHDQNGDGAYFTPTHVYLGLHDPKGIRNPNARPYFISQSKSVLSIKKSSDIVIDGLDRSLMFKHGANYGIYLSESTDVTVNAVAVVNSISGIYVGGPSGSPMIATRIRITDNLVTRDHHADWTWGDVKHCYATYIRDVGSLIEDVDKCGCLFGRDGLEGGPLSNPNAAGVKTMEGLGIGVQPYNGSADTEIAYNEVTGFFDGINIGGGRDEDPNERVLVHHNHIHNIFDDALDAGARVIDGEFHYNLIHDAYVGFSLAPHHDGPTYVYGNLLMADKEQLYAWDFIDQSSEPKSSVVTKFQLWGPWDTTQVRFYYNTFFAKNEWQTPLWLSEGVEDFDFRNNIFYSNKQIVKASGLESADNNYDSNLFYSSLIGIGNPQGKSLYRDWNAFNGGTYLDLANVPMPAAWENNRQGDPQFVGGSLVDPQAYFQLGIESAGRQELGFVLAEIPASWPGAAVFEGRTSAGCFEYATSGLRAHFLLDVEREALPVTASFTNLSEEAQSWQWDFGDGTTSAELHPVHTYKAPGEYTVVLTVFNGAQADQFSRSLTVTPAVLWRADDQIDNGWWSDAWRRHRSYRNLLKGEFVHAGSNRIQIAFDGRSDTKNYTVMGATIAERQIGTMDIVGVPVSVTFDGSDSVEIAPGERVFSDEIDFQMTEGTEYFVTFHTSGKPLRRRTKLDDPDTVWITKQGDDQSQASDWTDVVLDTSLQYLYGVTEVISVEAP
ncbi:PKD domain-containing protein [Sulfidibacter corallicola]|uniref:PKD domain-containing protein n=1 Tax=Sulfidibacter corallicola TaxID=2818388 RepID=A0A8A4TLB2_SULCO|nr:PKD domain-containing protein [Sulfidibacter corallicola]QTD50363.1 PKD domain-containing protein [Sulfidibacter corallicola]